jgi:IS5 family transposase
MSEGRQQTFSGVEFESYGKRTRRAEFLERMNVVVPWGELCAEIEPFYPKSGGGRPPVGLERMLRMYFVQNWFNLSDPAVEEALYDSVSLRVFVGVDLGREPVPDETTICKFRHLLERHRLGPKIFARVNGYLASRGFKIGTGTIVDATLIAAPSSTKNKDQKRDPEMHQTRKGNEWHFGMKAHVGVDAATKLVHSVAATAANVHDSKMLAQLLHGEETAVWGDQGYQGQSKVIAQCAPRAEDLTCRHWRFKGRIREEVREANRIKARTRSRVEHVFATLKLRMGLVKVRYRGLAKNLHRLQVSFALVNLITAQKHLAVAGQPCA